MCVFRVARPCFPILQRFTFKSPVSLSHRISHLSLLLFPSLVPSHSLHPSRCVSLPCLTVCPTVLRSAHPLTLILLQHQRSPSASFLLLHPPLNKTAVPCRTGQHWSKQQSLAYCDPKPRPLTITLFCPSFQPTSAIPCTYIITLDIIHAEGIFHTFRCY